MEFVTALAKGEHIVSTYDFWGCVVVATNTRILLLGGEMPREVNLASFSLDMGRA